MCVSVSVCVCVCERECVCVVCVCGVWSTCCACKVDSHSDFHCMLPVPVLSAQPSLNSVTDFNSNYYHYFTI